MSEYSKTESLIVRVYKLQTQCAKLLTELAIRENMDEEKLFSIITPVAYEPTMACLREATSRVETLSDAITNSYVPITRLDSTARETKSPTEKRLAPMFKKPSYKK